MARRRSSFWKSFFGGSSKDSYSGLILGAIIVVVLGLLVANYFSKRNMLPPTNQLETSQSQEENGQITQDAAVQPGQDYKVLENDSLSAIAMKYYGSYDYWPVLVKANKIQNPNVIHKNATIKIPEKDEAERMRLELTATSYEVQQGDTLFTIAEKVYGNGNKWTLLDGANKIGRLPNGNPLIFTGSKLVVPR